MSKAKILKEFERKYQEFIHHPIELKDQMTFLSKALDSMKEEGYRKALNEAIKIFKALPENEPMTKNPVILELRALRDLPKTKGE